MEVENSVEKIEENANEDYKSSKDRFIEEYVEQVVELSDRNAVENQDENGQDTADECDEVFETDNDDEENLSEDDENDKTAMHNEMERLLAEIDHKSSESSNENILKTDDSSVCEEEAAMSDDNHADIECEGVLVSGVKQRLSSTDSSKRLAQAVLDSVRNMDNSEENQDFTGIDDRFVTRTRGRGRPLNQQKKKYRKSFGSDSSFTISTPSNSNSNSLHSSLTSLSEDNRKYAGDDERETDTPDVDYDDDIFKEYQLTLSHALDEEYSDETTPRVNENLDDTLHAAREIENEEDMEVKENDKSVYETPNASLTSDTFISASDITNINNNHEKSRTSENFESETCEKCNSSSLNGVVKNGENEIMNKKKIISPQLSSDGSEIGNENDINNIDHSKTPINSDGTVWRPLPKLPDHIAKKFSPDHKAKSPLMSTTSPKISRSKRSLLRQKKLSHASKEKYDNAKNNEKKLIKVDKNVDNFSTPSENKMVMEIEKDVKYSEVSSSLDSETKQSVEGRKLPDISNMKSRHTPPEFQSEFMRKRYGSPASSGTKSPTSPEFKTSSSTNTTSVQSDTPDDNADVSSKKKTISVDKTKLTAMNSVEDSSSQNEENSKKKIGVDSKLKNQFSPSVEPKGIDDIPFADDSEDDLLENNKEQFYTPMTSVKNKPEKLKEVQSKDVRKRILPIPPLKLDKLSTPTVGQSKGLREEERAKAKEKARQKARLKSDEELGISDINYTPISAKKIQRKLRRELSTPTSNTPSTSDMISESDENKKSVSENKSTVLHSTPINALAKTPKTKEKKKKKKDSVDTLESGLSDIETPNKTTKKKKSLLQILKPSKSPDHPKELKEKNKSSSTDTLDEKSAKKKKKTPKTDKKKKRQKSVDPAELKELPSVFSEKVKLRQTNSQKRPSVIQRRSMPPRADCMYLFMNKCKWVSDDFLLKY